MQRRPIIIRLRQRHGPVHEVVERSIAQTRDRIGANLANMTTAELRGYVKARATAPVFDQVRRLIAERRLDANFAAEVVEQSIERVTHSIVREAALPPVVSLPPTAVPMRAAA